MNKEILKPIGILFYVIGAADFAGMFLGYDFTGVEWSPIAFGVVGYLCFFYSEEVKLGEGEELLTFRDGKKAEVTVTIGIGGGTGSSHKLYLTNQKVQIDGGKVSIELPYAEIKSASKDTAMKMDVALKLVTRSSEEYKLVFGIGRSKKRNCFLETISSKLSETSHAGPYGVQGNDTLAGVAPHNTTSNVNYYYFDQTTGEVIGPKTRLEMTRLRFENRINDETQVTEAGVENWQPFQLIFG